MIQTIEQLLKCALLLSKTQESVCRPLAAKPEIWDARHDMLESLMRSYNRGAQPDYWGRIKHVRP